MSFSAHYLFAVLLTIFSLPTSLWAQSAPRENPKSARGSVSGRVSLKGKGVFGVVVALRKLEQGNSNERAPRAITDQDGFYRIVNVVPGSYEVWPTAPAFVSTDGRDLRNTNVLVGEEENVENINFTLARGGVITGRVTDADGRPVIAQQVYIYRTDDFQPRRQPGQQVFAASSAPTDDRGIYRVFGLMPGRYKVASGRSENVFTGSLPTARSSYAQVFHPDATEAAKATVIDVAEGTEATNIDITLGRALPTFSVSGRVVDGEKNSPVPNIRLVFQRRVGERVESVNLVSVSDLHGEFVTTGLIPGKYGVYLISDESGGMRAEPITFDVVDQDVSGITVKLVQGASLSGVVVLETPNPAAATRFSELRLRVFVNDPARKTGSSGVATVAPNGTFSVIGLSGGMANMFLNSATTSIPPKGFSLVRVERDGVVLPREIPLQEREQLTGLTVVLAYGTATIRGVVEIENGPIPNGARIYVSLLKPGEQFTNLRPPPVDARGRFLIEGVPPGTYTIQAAVASPSSKGRYVRREITVQDGVTTDITLTVDMNPPQEKQP